MYIKLKKLNLVIFMISAFSLIIMAAPPELHVVGTQLQTVSGGCPVRLAGVDVDGLEWSPANDGANGAIANSVTGAISNWHANFVRIPVSQDFWYGYKNTHGQPSSAAAYIAFVDSAVAAASNANSYAEIDLHWSGTGSFGTSDAQEDMPDDNSTTFWQAVATHYANNPAVFFDLYNEPKDDTWAIWKGGGQSASGFHTPGFQALVKTIRDTGAKNVIVIGGLGWAWDMTGISANSITDTNTAGNMSGDGIMYEAHIYDNKGGTTEAQKIALWNSNVSVAVQAGFCVDIGEFGPMTDGSQDNGGCTPFDTDLLSWINGNNTAAPGNKSYVFNAMAWDFNTAAAPLLLSSFTNFTATTCHGAAVKSWLAAITPTICSGGSTPTYTPTPTFTRTNTFTETRTPTQTFTRTFTPTFTVTFTSTVPSATPTFTKTFTPTFTVTFTSTVPSATPTFTKTFTPTFTVTYTSTVPSATPTFTKTFTPTDTATDTSTVPAATPSFTSTFTATATVTFTSTVSSLTPTFTLSSTQSSTATKTSTPTDIVTATVTPTSTVTQANPTATFTGTNTAILPSATFTSTAQDTATPANTMSPTQQPPTSTNTAVIPSATATPTPINTQTTTQTTVPTQPDTATPTFTFTSVPPTSTSTNTWTAVATATFTFTQTWTQVNTSTTLPTLTPTLTWTLTPTNTPSYTDTPTPVPTFAVTPVGTWGIFKPVLYLNQNSTNISLEMTVPVAASEVEVIIYTKAFRKVVDTKYTSGLTFPQINLKLIEGITDNFARGVYYYVVIYTDVNGKVTKSKISAFIIAR